MMLYSLLLAALVVGRVAAQDFLRAHRELTNPQCYGCDCFNCALVRSDPDDARYRLVTLDHSCKINGIITWICCTTPNCLVFDCVGSGCEQDDTVPTAKCEGVGEKTGMIVKVPADTTSITINTHDEKTNGGPTSSPTTNYANPQCGDKVTRTCQGVEVSTHCLVTFDLNKDCKTQAPTRPPTSKPTKKPTSKPTSSPTRIPTSKPTKLLPTQAPPTSKPTPTSSPTRKLTSSPTGGPTLPPTSKPTPLTPPPTGVPTSKPTPLTSPPTRIPTSMPIPAETLPPTRAPTLPPTLAPTQITRSGGWPTTAAPVEMSGDPHLKSWSGEWFDYQGECDLRLLHAPKFDGTLDMDIHVRTTIEFGFSYIEAAAVRIGDDILEVGSYGDYALNGVEGALRADDMVPRVGRYPVYYKMVNKKKHMFDIVIAKDENVTLTAYKSFVSVKIFHGDNQRFGAVSGMMGTFDGKMLARNGTSLHNDVNGLAQDWQVLPEEGNYFRTARDPQYPQECRLPLSQAQVSRQL